MLSAPQETTRLVEVVSNSGIPLPVEPEPSEGHLLRQLARTLDAHGIAYCQWRGHWSSHRWATGQGGVDLLVDRDALQKFRQLVSELGFKLALPRGERQILGVETYVGHDPDVPRLLGLQVQYRLLLGDFWKPTYRIPLERPLLEATRPGDLFRLPSPTYQFAVFVFRMMLRQFGRPLLSLQRRWLAGIQAPLASLEAGCDWNQLNTLFEQHLPTIDVYFFERCVRSLQGHSGWLERAILPWLLARRLHPQGRRPRLSQLTTVALEKFAPERVVQTVADRRVRLSAGGTVVSLIGGNGTGKSSCARELRKWLEPVFPTMRAQLGTPPRTLLTYLVDGALGLRQRALRGLKREVQPAGFLELLRNVCTARDRYRLYTKVQRFASSGGIALCEDYPVEQNRLLVGPGRHSFVSRESGLLRSALQALEASYYNRMVGPDVLCVLRLDPDSAVQRKREEAADLVRSQARIIWEADWSSTRAHIVDGSRTLPEVLRQLKSILWQEI